MHGTMSLKFGRLRCNFRLVKSGVYNVKRVDKTFGYDSVDGILNVISIDGVVQS
jgi:hypothetical protein